MRPTTIHYFLGCSPRLEFCHGLMLLMIAASIVWKCSQERKKRKKSLWGNHLWLLLQQKGALEEEVARKGFASKRDFFSPTTLEARNKATVANTFVFWMFPKVSQNYYSDSATRPAGISCSNREFESNLVQTFMWRSIAVKFMAQFAKKKLEWIFQIS